MMQSLSLLLSNDDDRLIKKRDNLTPRHLHAYIDDELQKTYPNCMCCNIDEWQNWSRTVVEQFLWIMGPFLSALIYLFSLLSIGALVVILIEREKKNDTSLFLSLSLFFVYTRANTDVNFENLQLSKQKIKLYWFSFFFLIKNLCGIYSIMRH
jgi:hypothetical protein